MLNGVVKLYTLCCDGNPVILDYLQNDLLKSLINSRDYWEGNKSAGLGIYNNCNSSFILHYALLCHNISTSHPIIAYCIITYILLMS